MQGAVCPTELVLSASYQYSYDRQGNTLSDGENQYRYDSLNRLTEVKTQNGDLQKNHYEGEGLRAGLEENGELTRFLYSGRDVVAEQDEKNNIIRYVRGLELLSSDCECARTYYHYASDELGSITHVTDENGTVLNRYVYDAFGNRTVKEETVQNRFGITGEICDGLTGQYYLRARFYNPVIGRFLNEDTYYGDGLNLYSYCRNNPVRYVDPSGNWCERKEGKRVPEDARRSLKNTNDNIKNIVDTNGLRNDLPLTTEQIKELKEYAIKLGFPEKNIHIADMVNSGNTGMLCDEMLIINNDVLPTSLPAKNPNSLVSGRGAIAHEIVGHYETALKGTSFDQYDLINNELVRNSYNAALDEAQASIREQDLLQI